MSLLEALIHASDKPQVEDNAAQTEALQELVPPRSPSPVAAKVPTPTWQGNAARMHREQEEDATREGAELPHAGEMQLNGDDDVVEGSSEESSTGENSPMQSHRAVETKEASTITSPASKAPLQRLRSPPRQHLASPSSMGSRTTTASFQKVDAYFTARAADDGSGHSPWAADSASQTSEGRGSFALPAPSSPSPQAAGAIVRGGEGYKVLMDVGPEMRRSIRSLYADVLSEVFTALSKEFDPARMKHQSPHLLVRTSIIR